MIRLETGMSGWVGRPLFHLSPASSFRAEATPFETRTAQSARLFSRGLPHHRWRFVGGSAEDMVAAVTNGPAAGIATTSAAGRSREGEGDCREALAHRMESYNHDLCSRYHIRSYSTEFPISSYASNRLIRIESLGRGRKGGGSGPLRTLEGTCEAGCFRAASHEKKMLLLKQDRMHSLKIAGGKRFRFL